MSDIKKKLILEASLDDQKLKKQIQDLKKSIESVSIKQKINQQTSSSLRSARTQDNSEKQKNAEINKAYKQREDEIKKQAQIAKALYRQEIAEAKKTAEVKKQLAKEVAAFEAQTQKDKVSGKEKAVSSFKKVQAEQQKADEKRQKEELAHAKRIEDLKDKAQEKRLREAARDMSRQSNFSQFDRKSRMTSQERLKEELMAKHGHKLDDRSMMTKGLDYLESRGGRLGRGVGRVRGMRLGMAGGAAIGIGAAALGAGVIADSYMRQERENRILRAQRQQEQLLMESQGLGVDAAISESGRREGGSGFKGMAASAGRLVSDVFSGNFVKAFSGQSIEEGRLTAGVQEAQARLEELAGGRQALQAARGTRGAVRGLLRGGETTEADIINQQAFAADRFALSPNQTLQDLATARESLGQRAASQRITSLQRLREQTGVDIGQMAGAAETLGGFSGQGSAAGVSQVQKVFKDAVSTGLDASKSGKFLQATAQYIESTAGFANVDTGQISGRMADLTSGFAGPGGPTLVDIQKAQQAQMMLQQESFGESGLAGVGNVTGVMKALGPNATGDQFLAALGASSNATVEDLVGLGLSEDQAKAVQGMKQQDSLARGTELLGLDSGSGTGAYLAARERGTTTESQLALDRAVRTGEATGPGELPGVARDSEAFRSLAQESKRSAENIREGFDTLREESDILSKRFSDFAEQLRQQTTETRNLLRQIQRSQ